MDRRVKWKKATRSLSAVLLGLAPVLMSTALFEPVHGHFYFRQGHVMANIEKYVANGLSLQPSTYNRDIPYSLFDFPAYELLAASLSRRFARDPLIVSRLLSLLCFVGALLVIDRILVVTAQPRLQRFVVLFLFAFSPLCLFYFVSPLVDDLALVCSFVSVYAFLRWFDTSFALRWYWPMLVAGVLATLIKNPVYLPVATAIGVEGIVRSKARFLLRWDSLAFFAAIAAAVLAFKYYANHVNGIDVFLSPSETSDYFGPLADRLDPRSWRRIFEVERKEMLNPLTWPCALFGIVLFARPGVRFKGLYLGLAGGGLLSLLVFFQRYTWHDYYQLPLEFPFAFFAAVGLTGLFEASRRLASRAPIFEWPSMLLVPAVLGATLFYGVAGFEELSSTPTDWIERNGDWIREKTAPTDFVVYVLDTEDRRDWNPVFLYFAKRDGYNLPRKRVGRRVLSRVQRRFGEDYARCLVFCPSGLTSTLEPRLVEAGALLYEAGPPGSLYLLTPPASPSPAP